MDKKLFKMYDLLYDLVNMYLLMDKNGSPENNYNDKELKNYRSYIYEQILDIREYKKVVADID